MKAISLQAVGRVGVVETPQPEPGRNQLLVRTGASTICTSDLTDIAGNPFGLRLPVVLGHEAAGTVAGVGKDVVGFKVGDRVATHPVHPCLACDECRAGRGHLCPNMQHFGVNIQGTFAEYFLVRSDRARKVPSSVAFRTAALAEPVCVCLQALAQAKISPEGSLLIIGDGPFGLIMARLAGRMGLGRLVLAGEHDFRLGLAPGATTVNIRKTADPHAHLVASNSGREFDSVIAAVGSPQAVEWGVQLLRPKGRLVLFAAALGRTPVDLVRVHAKELEIVGACNDEDRFDEAVRLLADPQLALDQLVTHRCKWQDYEKALSMAGRSHDSVAKIALVWDERELA